MPCAGLTPTRGAGNFPIERRVMTYIIDDKLVIAVASSALFDLSESDRVFREHGVEAYRDHQLEREDEILLPGAAFALVKRLLSLNGPDEGERPVEVILLSRNDPGTGMRVFNSVDHYGLDVSRAAFLSGGDPFKYLDAFNAALFLSANPDDVLDAVRWGVPAGRVFPTAFVDDDSEHELRIAFDFDGVIADDSADSVHREQGLAEFEASELAHALEPLREGPLHRFFTGIAQLQARELDRSLGDNTFRPRLRIAIVTARRAPAHRRVVTSLRKWGLAVDETFFLGGIDKSRVLRIFKPHIFFDDRLDAVQQVSGIVPSAHVPFGIANHNGGLADAG